MASIINASTTGIGGLETIADNSGILTLQTGGSDRVTVGTNGNVSIGTNNAASRVNISNSSTTAYSLISQTPIVGLTAGNFVNMAYFTNSRSTNNDGLRIVNLRDSTGSGIGNWETESYRIRRSVDSNDGSSGVQEEIIFGNNTLRFSAGGQERIYIDASGNVGIGLIPSGIGLLEIAAGTSTKAPLELTAGTLTSSPVVGAVEYDGVTQYFVGNATSGRGYTPTTQIFRLAANGSAIGPTIANYFGANSAINLIGGGTYEIEVYCYFTKTTAGTVVITATSSLAPVNLNGIVQFGPATGGTAQGASGQISLFNSTSTAAAFGASPSLTTGVNHAMIIRLIVEANASASNLRINFTSSAGTVTPLRGSYYKVTRLPAANTGSFAA
jgi:hypothetical protein